MSNLSRKQKIFHIGHIGIFYLFFLIIYALWNTDVAGLHNLAQNLCEFGGGEASNGRGDNCFKFSESFANARPNKGNGVTRSGVHGPNEREKYTQNCVQLCNGSPRIGPPATLNLCGMHGRRPWPPIWTTVSCAFGNPA